MYILLHILTVHFIWLATFIFKVVLDLKISSQKVANQIKCYIILKQGPSFFTVLRAHEIACFLANPLKSTIDPWNQLNTSPLPPPNPDSLYLIYQISDIIHFEVQFPARDIQACSDFYRTNHQNQARERLHPITSINET